jgi:hypothetical protein
VGNPSLWKNGAPPGYVGGRFKNNWQTNLGAIDFRDNAPPNANGTGSRDRARDVLRSFRAGHTIFMTNSLPYAQRIETGWSSQAPRGVVRLTVIAYANALRQAVREAQA